MKEIPRANRSSVDAYIRIYKDRCVLSARACVILALSPVYPRVRFTCNEHGVFISHSDSTDGYVVARKKGRRSGHINSVFLAETLAETLQGQGLYCIGEENFRYFPILKREA